MAGLECGVRGIGRTIPGSGSGTLLSAGALTLCGAFSSADNHSFGDFFFRHSTAADFSFIADLPKPVLAGNSSNGRDERFPSMSGIDFVKTEQKPCVQSGCDRADVSFDLSSLLDGETVGCAQRLGDAGMEVITRLHIASVETIG